MPFFESIQEKWEDFLDFAAEKGFTPLKSFAAFLEEKGIPSLPIFALALIFILGALFVGFGGLELGKYFKQSNDLEISVLGAGVRLPAGNLVTLKFDDGRPNLEKSTDSSGRVVFTDVKVGSFSATVQADGFEQKVERFDFSDYSKKFFRTVDLDPIRSIKVALTVKVAGVTSASVSIFDQFEQTLIASSSKVIETFSLDPEKTYIVAIQSGSVVKKDTVYLSSEPKVVDFNLQPEEVLSIQKVHVCAAVDESCVGTGLPNVTVVIRDGATGAVFSSQVTGADGSIEATELKIGSNLTLSASLKGFASEPKNGVVSERELDNYFVLRLVNISAADRSQLNIDVRDESGELVFNPIIRLLDSRKNVIEEVAAAEGKHSFTVNKNQAYYVVIFKDGYLAAVMQNVRAGSHVFTLKEASTANSGSLTVGVLNFDGNALKGASVVLMSKGIAFAPEKFTDLDGNAFFFNVPVGLYDVIASNNDRDSTVRANVEAGVDKLVSMKFSRKQSKLFVSAFDAFSNAPIASARISLSDSNYSCDTDASGKCQINALEGFFTAKVVSSSFQEFESQPFALLPGNNNQSFALQSLEAQRAAKVEFVGLYDLKGNKVSSLSPSTAYNAKFVLTAPLTREKPLRTIAIIQLARRDVATAEITSFSNSDAFVITGSGDFAYVKANSSNLPAQFVAFEFNNFAGSRQLQLQVKTKAVESGSLQLQYKAGFLMPNEQLFDPSNLLLQGQVFVQSVLPQPSLETVEAQAARLDGFIQQLSQLDTKKSDFPISFEGRCQGDYCFQFSFEQNGRKNVNNFEASLGDFNLVFKILPSSANASNAQVTVSTDSASLQLRQLQSNVQTVSSQQNAASQSLAVAARPSQADEGFASFSAVRLSKDASIKFSAALPGALFEQAFPIRIIGRDAPSLGVAAKPVALQALKENAISFEVKDAIGLPVENARVSIGTSFDALKSTVDAAADAKGVYKASVTPVAVGPIEYYVQAEGFKTFRGFLASTASRVVEVDSAKIDLLLQTPQEQKAEFAVRNLLDNKVVLDIAVQKKPALYSNAFASLSTLTLEPRESRTISLSASLLESLLQVSEKPQTLKEKVDGNIQIIARAGSSTQTLKVPFSINVEFKQEAISSVWSVGSEELTFELQQGKGAEASLVLYNNAVYPLLVNPELRQPPQPAQGISTVFRIDPISIIAAPLDPQQFKIAASQGGVDLSQCIFEDVLQEGRLRLVASFQGVASEKNVALKARIPSSQECHVKDAASPIQTPLTLTLVLPKQLARQKVNPDNSRLIQVAGEQFEARLANARGDNLDLPFGAELVLPTSRLSSTFDSKTFSLPVEVQFSIPKEANLSIQSGKLVVTTGSPDLGLYQFITNALPNPPRERPISLPPNTPITFKELKPPEAVKTPIELLNEKGKEKSEKDLQDEKKAKLDAAANKSEISKPCTDQNQCSAYLMCQNSQCFDVTPLLGDLAEVQLPLKLILQIPSNFLTKREGSDSIVLLPGRAMSFQNAQVLRTIQGTMLTVPENALMSLPRDQVVRFANPLQQFPGSNFVETGEISIRFPFQVRLVVPQNVEIVANKDGTQSIILREEEIAIPASIALPQGDGSRQIALQPNAFIKRKPIDINLLDGVDVKLGVEATFKVSTAQNQARVRDNGGGSIAVQLQDGRKILFKDSASLQQKLNEKDVKVLETGTIALHNSLVKRHATSRDASEVLTITFPLKWEFKVPQGALVSVERSSTIIQMENSAIKIPKQFDNLKVGSTVPIPGNTAVDFIAEGISSLSQRIILEYPYKVSFKVAGQKRDAIEAGKPMTSFELSACERVSISEGVEGVTTTPKIKKITVSKCNGAVSCRQSFINEHSVEVEKSEKIYLGVCAGLKDEKDKTLKKKFGREVVFEFPSGTGAPVEEGDKVVFTFSSCTTLNMLFGGYSASWVVSEKVYFPKKLFSEKQLADLTSAETKRINVKPGEEVEFLPCYDIEGRGLGLKISDRLDKVKIDTPMDFQFTTSEPVTKTFCVNNSYSTNVEFDSDPHQTWPRPGDFAELKFSLPETFAKSLPSTPILPNQCTKMEVVASLPLSLGISQEGSKCLTAAKQLDGKLLFKLHSVDRKFNFESEVDVKVNATPQEDLQTCLQKESDAKTPSNLKEWTEKNKLLNDFTTSNSEVLQQTGQTVDLYFKDIGHKRFITISNNRRNALTLKVQDAKNIMSCKKFQTDVAIHESQIASGETVIAECIATTSTATTQDEYYIIGFEGSGANANEVLRKRILVTVFELTSPLQKGVYASTPIGEVAPQEAIQTTTREPTQEAKITASPSSERAGGGFASLTPSGEERVERISFQENQQQAPPASTAITPTSQQPQQGQSASAQDSIPLGTTQHIVLCQNHFCNYGQSRLALNNFGKAVSSFVDILYSLNVSEAGEYCKNAVEENGKKAFHFSIPLMKVSTFGESEKDKDFAKDLRNSLRTAKFSPSTSIRGDANTIAACGIYTVKAKVEGCENPSQLQQLTKIEVILPTFAKESSDFKACDETLANAILLTAGDKEYVVGRRVVKWPQEAGRVASEFPRLFGPIKAAVQAVGGTFSGFNYTDAGKGLADTAVFGLGKYGKEENLNDVKLVDQITSQMYNGNSKVTAKQLAEFYSQGDFCRQQSNELITTAGILAATGTLACAGFSAFLPAATPACIKGVGSFVSTSVGGCLSANVERVFSSGDEATCNVASFCSVGIGFGYISGLLGFFGGAGVPINKQAVDAILSGNKWYNRLGATGKAGLKATALDTTIQTVAGGGLTIGIEGLRHFAGDAVGTAVGLILPLAIATRSAITHVQASPLSQTAHLERAVAEQLGISREEARSVVESLGSFRDSEDASFYRAAKKKLDDFNAGKPSDEQLSMSELKKKIEDGEFTREAEGGKYADLIDSLNKIPDEMQAAAEASGTTSAVANDLENLRELKKHYDSLKKENKKLEEIQAQVREAEEIVRTKGKGFLNSNQRKVDKLKQKETEAKAKVGELTALIDEIKKPFENARKKTVELNENIEKLTKDFAENPDKVNLVQDLAKARERLERAESALQRIQSASSFKEIIDYVFSLKSKSDELTKAIEARNKEIETAQKQMDDALKANNPRSYNSWLGKLTSARAEKSAAEGRLNEINDELDAFGFLNDKLGKEAGKAKASQAATAKFDASEDEAAFAGKTSTDIEQPKYMQGFTLSTTETSISIKKRKADDPIKIKFFGDDSFKSLIDRIGSRHVAKKSIEDAKQAFGVILHGLQGGGKSTAFEASLARVMDLEIKIQDNIIQVLKRDAPEDFGSLKTEVISENRPWVEGGKFEYFADEGIAKKAFDILDGLSAEKKTRLLESIGAEYGYTGDFVTSVLQRSRKLIVLDVRPAGKLLSPYISGGTKKVSKLFEDLLTKAKASAGDQNARVGLLLDEMDVIATVFSTASGRSYTETVDAIKAVLTDPKFKDFIIVGTTNNVHTFELALKDRFITEYVNAPSQESLALSAEKTAPKIRFASDVEKAKFISEFSKIHGLTFRELNNLFAKIGEKQIDTQTLKFVELSFDKDIRPLLLKELESTYKQRLTHLRSLESKSRSQGYTTESEGLEIDDLKRMVDSMKKYLQDNGVNVD